MRTPRLQLYKTGVYFTRWGGKIRYFTTDEAESRRLFLSLKSTPPPSLAA